jgi:hypothetical protein
VPAEPFTHPARRTGAGGRGLGFLLLALGFRDVVGANKDFAFLFRHPEKVCQWVKARRDRHGFEPRGHVDDVTGDVDCFAGSSRRSRGTALSGSPMYAFSSRETYVRGRPMKLSHLAERSRCLRSRRLQEK